MSVEEHPDETYNGVLGGEGFSAGFMDGPRPLYCGVHNCPPSHAYGGMRNHYL